MLCRDSSPVEGKDERGLAYIYALLSLGPVCMPQFVLVFRSKLSFCLEIASTLLNSIHPFSIFKRLLILTVSAGR